MNREDMAAKKLKKGDLVTLYNNYDGRERLVEGFAVVPYDIPKQCVATYFPEANPLVPISLMARASHTPASKSVKVKIKQ
jgi:anaerobic selenocysteine-containing dehydrogenase